MPVAWKKTTRDSRRTIKMIITPTPNGRTFFPFFLFFFVVGFLIVFPPVSTADQESTLVIHHLPIRVKQLDASDDLMEPSDQVLVLQVDSFSQLTFEEVDQLVIPW